MSIKTQESTAPRSLTHLQDFLNMHKNRPNIHDVPPLNDQLLKRARNCVPHSLDNNDLLEFIGDRAVNLASALLVEKVKLSKSHHTVSRHFLVIDLSSWLCLGGSQCCV